MKNEKFITNLVYLNILLIKEKNKKTPKPNFVEEIEEKMSQLKVTALYEKCRCVVRETVQV